MGKQWEVAWSVFLYKVTTFDNGWEALVMATHLGDTADSFWNQFATSIALGNLKRGFENDLSIYWELSWFLCFKSDRLYADDQQRRFLALLVKTHWTLPLGLQRRNSKARQADWKCTLLNWGASRGIYNFFQRKMFEGFQQGFLQKNDIFGKRVEAAFSFCPLQRWRKGNLNRDR